MERLSLSGRVSTGLGRGASFTRVDWVREQLLAELGIEPYPGTLNLALETDADRAAWARVKALPACLLVSPDPRWCCGRGYPARIAGRLPGAILVPEVADYPPAQVEVVAALPLRRELALAEGDRVSLEIAGALPARAVIFDVDGTLVDSLEAYRTVAERAAAPFGLAITAGVVRQALNTNQPFWDIVLPEGQPDRADMIGRMEKEASRQWPEVLRSHGRAFPGLRRTLDDLRGRGARLGIVTGSPGASLPRLEEEGLLELFGAVITGREVARVKPDPEGLLKCAQALGVEPGESVYVGDTPLDIRASRAAGMASVAVLSGAGDSALLSAEGPHRIIHSHARLPEVLEVLP